MSTNFPTALDALTNPAATDVLTGHAAQHSNANDAIEALQAKVGVNSSAVATSLDYKVSALESSRELAANKGVAGGYASLDGAGKVPAAQLPSYVDDVLGYANLAGFPVTGEPGKIYVAEDTNKTYRWSGSAYVYITSGAVDSVAGKTGVVTLVKGDVGLANVDNTSDANKPVSTATQAALDLKANLSSPALSGTPTAPTAIVGTDTTQVATTAFVNAEIANDAAPKLHVGATGTAHGVATTSVAGFMSATDKTKLDGIATGATNTPLSSVAPSALGVAAAGTSTSAARADHVHAAQTSVTGNAGSATKLETVRTINGVSFDGTANITISATDSTARIASSEKGVPNGVATLDASGMVPSTQLPSYVDDVLEYANTAGFPVTGETAKIYVALDSNKVYRWSGSAYVEIMSSPGSTDVVTEGSTNLYFKESRVRNTVLSGISLLTNATVTAADSVLSAFGKIQKQITDHLANVSNPHSVTKAQVGLGNVDDTSDANKPVSTAQQSALNLKANLSGADFTGPASVTVSSASPALKITQTGTGNALVVEDAASDTTPFVIDSSGAVGIGTTPEFGGVTINKSGNYSLTVKSDDYTTIQIRSYRESSSDHAQLSAFAARGTEAVPASVVSGDRLLSIKAFGWDGSSWVQACQIRAESDGTPGTNDMPGRLVFSTTADGASSPTARMQIDSSGNVIVKSAAGLGYGTGAGGTVTQATSKSTAVTLNKPTGQITMNSAALAAGATVSFTFNNSLIAASDVVLLTPCGGFSVSGNYSIRVGNTQTGAISVFVKNESAGSLSEAVLINFAIIKGATA